jgi:uncharacterized protein YbaP (TraB family)
VRRAAFALAALLALAGCGEPARDWPVPRPALWEVSGPRGEHGWLFGTIHSLPEGVRWRTPAVDRALASSGVLVVEIANLEDADEGAAEFRRYATTPGLPPLSRRVPPEDRPAVAALLDRADMEDDDFPDTETWGAAVILASRASRSKTANGVDRALIEAAPRVVGLESFAGQYALFDRLSPVEQVHLLLALAADAEGATQDKRIRAWLTGDLATLEDDAEAVLADPDLREALQIRRNHAWNERIAEILASGQKPFVAVGAGHMLGPQGLPALLAARGYAVRRVQ